MSLHLLIQMRKLRGRQAKTFQSYEYGQWYFNRMYQNPKPMFPPSLMISQKHIWLCPLTLFSPLSSLFFGISYFFISYLFWHLLPT